MHRFRTAFAVVLVVSLVAASAVVVAEPPRVQTVQGNEINSCTTIEQPGTYTLTQNVENHSFERSVESAPPVCIRVQADDVVIRGNGNRIDGTGGGIGISVSYRTNVTVQDVTVTDWRTGVRVSNVTGASVSGVVATGNGLAGVDIFGSPGVTVRDIEASANGLHGVEVANSADVHVANATVDDNGRDGVSLSNSANATVESVTARSSGGAGVSALKSPGVTVTDLVAVDSGYWGIVILSPGATVRSADVRDSSAGIWAVSDELDIQNATVRDSKAGSGISISGRNVTVQNTTATGNVVSGLSASWTKGLTVRNSTFDDNQRYGVDVGFSNDTSLHNVSAEGNSWAFVSTGSSEVTVTGFDVGEGTASFTMTNVRVRSVTYPPRVVEGHSPVDQFLQVERTDFWMPGQVDVAFHYTDEAAADLEESSLRVWLFDGNQWSQVPEPNRVDTERNVVTANVTTDGIVAPLARPANGSTDAAPSGQSSTVALHRR